MGMDEYLAANRALWDEWTAIHETSSFYDLEAFKAGGSRLRDYEVDEVGDVTGKSLLHLQCHFGIDTLSWARLGARVTGADFSDRAIELGRSLAAELRLDATFVRSDLYDLPSVLDGQFDVVYTSRGVLGWLPDLGRWAGVVAHFLRPGGVFYMTEIHPVAQAFAFVDWPVPFLVRQDDGTWCLPPDAGGELPLFFSLRAQPLTAPRVKPWTKRSRKKL